MVHKASAPQASVPDLPLPEPWARLKFRAPVSKSKHTAGAYLTAVG